MKVQLIAVALAPVVYIIVTMGCSNQQSDESILRAEFKIPNEAALVSYKAHPVEDAWIREGLKIDIVFQLSDQAYTAYVRRAKEEGQWQPLPIPNDFLSRLGAIETRKSRRTQAYQLKGKILPEEGSIYNPTKKQLLDRFIISLPKTSGVGLFQCRSAGDDILHARKTIHSRIDRDLNDFMLAILDHEQKQIVIQVSSNY